MEEQKTRVQLQSELREKTVGYIATALGLVAGLAWNDAITSLISVLFPLDRGTVIAKFGYATLITIVVVVGTMYLLKLTRNKNN